MTLRNPFHVAVVLSALPVLCCFGLNENSTNHTTGAALTAAPAGADVTYAREATVILAASVASLAAAIVHPPSASDVCLPLLVAATRCSASETAPLVVRAALGRTFILGATITVPGAESSSSLAAQIGVVFAAAVGAQGALLLACLAERYFAYSAATLRKAKGVLRERHRRERQQADEDQWRRGWHAELEKHQLTAAAAESPGTIDTNVDEAHNGCGPRRDPPPSLVNGNDEDSAREEGMNTTSSTPDKGPSLWTILVTSAKERRAWWPCLLDVTRESFCPGVAIAVIQVGSPGILWLAVRTFMDSTVAALFAGAVAMAVFGAVAPALEYIWQRHWRMSAWIPLNFAFVRESRALQRLAVPRGAWWDCSWVTDVPAGPALNDSDDYLCVGRCHASAARGVARWSFSSLGDDGGHGERQRSSAHGEVRRWYSLLLPWRCPGLEIAWHAGAAGQAVRNTLTVFILALAEASEDTVVCSVCRILSVLPLLAFGFVAHRTVAYNVGLGECVCVLSAILALLWSTILTAAPQLQQSAALPIAAFFASAAALAGIGCAALTLTNLRWLRTEAALRRHALAQATAPSLHPTTTTASPLYPSTAGVADQVGGPSDSRMDRPVVPPATAAVMVRTGVPQLNPLLTLAESNRYDRAHMLVY